MSKLAAIKVGDQYNPFRKNNGCKEGMIVEHGQDVYSDDMKRIFATIIFPDAYTADLITAVHPALDAEDNLIRERVQYLDLKKLAQDLGDPGLYERWLSGNVVEPVRYSGPNIGEIRNVMLTSVGKDWSKLDPKTDRNAIFGGVNTYGSSGTYSTITALASDMGTQTSNLTARIVGDSTSTAFANFTHDGASYDILLDSDDPHVGLVTGGHLLTINYNHHGIINSITNPGLYEVKDFNMKSIVAGTNNHLHIAVTVAGKSLNCHDMFLNGGGLNQRGAIKLGRLNGNKVYNCVIWGFAQGKPIDLVDVDAGVPIIENITTVSSQRSIKLRSKPVTVRNYASFDGPGLNYDDLQGATGNYTMSTDTTNENTDWSTGANNFSDVTTLDQIISTTDTNTDFCRPKVSGDMLTAGEDPDITVDMKGDEIVSPYFIGAYGPAVASGNPYYAYAQQQ